MFGFWLGWNPLWFDHSGTFLVWKNASFGHNHKLIKIVLKYWFQIFLLLPMHQSCCRVLFFGLLSTRSHKMKWDCAWFVFFPVLWTMGTSWPRHIFFLSPSSYCNLKNHLYILGCVYVSRPTVPSSNSGWLCFYFFFSCNHRRVCIRFKLTMLCFGLLVSNL